VTDWIPALDDLAYQGPLLEVDNLRVEIASRRGNVQALDGVSLQVAKGEIVGVVGESGCGKSTLCFAIARALSANSSATGSIRLRGEELMTKSERQMREVRGRDLAMILQNPMMSLDPVFTIGTQLIELLNHVAGTPRREQRETAIDLLRQVQIPAAESRLGNYPHQLSGGMRHRVVTAMATSSRPALILADEPTTALDVTVQDQILALFREIRDVMGCAIVLVTHDLGVVRRLCDRVVVMYAGHVVEQAAVEDLFRAPKHPYTQALIATLPRLGQVNSRLPTIEGRLPDLTQPQPGCPFVDRCPSAMSVCANTRPRRTALPEGGEVYCHLYGDAERVQ
jgi:oligopeptide/dipeptide ABC transporter ATP-binding protein